MSALLLVACGERVPETVKLGGSTMGTSWHLSYLAPATGPDQQTVQEALQAELDAVNASMSTYQHDSEISRINRAPTDTWIAISTQLAQVLTAARDIAHTSEGAYDVTVGPLVDLWGFGPAGRRATVPGAEAIEASRQEVGFDYLELELDAAAPRLRKSRELHLDLSSIAKGYAVDRLALWLQSEQIDNFLVEVGGEMRLAGQSPRGDAWRIAVEQPDAATRQAAVGLVLSDVAVATSGDYRNFFTVDGERYSHSIDPRTGYAVRHDLVSVTVIHDSAMYADAWATALLVLGAEDAWRVANEAGLAVYFIRRAQDDYSSRYTANFAPYLADTAAPQ